MGGLRSEYIVRHISVALGVSYKDRGLQKPYKASIGADLIIRFIRLWGLIRGLPRII
jgi:hypothetical protein